MVLLIEKDVDDGYLLTVANDLETKSGSLGGDCIAPLRARLVLFPLLRPNPAIVSATAHLNRLD
ncbi:hypothetical protein [Pseudomonas sp. PDM25]|uniref:hypothetical protein n=1 Tax=Pseudomonas sp. PDM25 TaxID=2854772 RepID=UPI001C469224|nr:hypothetical protein [Pseudomonas sp. PDM25]MBV7515918.1 hypothetical protein [Pseudomonas sp. PDM25]